MIIESKILRPFVKLKLHSDSENKMRERETDNEENQQSDKSLFLMVVFKNKMKYISIKILFQDIQENVAK